MSALPLTETTGNYRVKKRIFGQRFVCKLILMAFVWWKSILIKIPILIFNYVYIFFFIPKTYSIFKYSKKCPGHIYMEYGWVGRS
jgi:hypothetical protein